MNISDKKYLDNVLLAIGFVGIVVVVFYMIHVFGPVTPVSEKIFPQEIHVQRHFVRELSVNRIDLFNTMKDVQSYPSYFPDTYVSVDIINQTGNVFYTNEVITYDGITKPLIVKHTIQPYDKQITEVVSGVAKGTVITTTFEDAAAGTMVTVDMHVYIKGVLVLPGMAPINGFNGAADSYLNSFVTIAHQNGKTITSTSIRK